MTVAYNAGTDTITVTDGTEGTPITFQDIKDADDGGGWGQTSKQNGNQYFLECNLSIGNASTTTWFASEREQIKIEGTFLVTVAATCRIGDWVDSHSINGSYWKFNKEYTGTTYYYLRGTFQVYGSILDARMQNGVTPRIYLRMPSGSNTEYRESQLNNFRGFMVEEADCLVDQVILRNCPFGYYMKKAPAVPWTAPYCGGGLVYFAHLTETATLYNVVLFNIGAYAYSLVGANVAGHLITVDPDNRDEGALGLVSIEDISSEDAEITLKYTFNLKVVNTAETAINGAAVKMWDTHDTLQVDTTTNASGVITQQELPWKNWKGTSETETAYNPYVLEISMAGYETYRGTITMDQPWGLHIVLKDAIKINLLDGEPIVKMHPESYEDKIRRKFIEV